MENLDDTNIEEEIQVEEQALTTEEPIQEETVDNYSEKLEDAETEEEAIAAFNDLETEEETLDESEAVESFPKDYKNLKEPTAELDTKAETSSEVFDLRDGDIQLSLDMSKEEERKQGLRLMQQGLNYAGKTTELAKHKSFVNYAEENNVSLEDIQLLAAAKSGDKSAIAKISQSANVDVFDLDNNMADEFKPSPVELSAQADPQIDIIANEILANDSYRDDFQKWFPTMPEDVQAQVMGNSQVLYGVQEDIQAGVFAPAMEQAYKYQRINGMDFGSAYTKAKNEFIAINQPKPSAPPVTRGERVRASAPKSGGGASTRAGGYAPGAISDMNDDDFLANYNDILRHVQTNR